MALTEHYLPCVEDFDYATNLIIANVALSHDDRNPQLNFLKTVMIDWRAIAPPPSGTATRRKALKCRCVTVGVVKALSM